jgi:hypothetical protein
MRLADANSVGINHILNLVGVYWRNSASIDILPRRVVNLKDLSKLCCKNIDELENMTFTHIFEKFFGSNIFDVNKYRSIMSEDIIKDQRRFCSHCLNEDGVYKLLWQVREIDSCDIHYSKLTSTCSWCHKEQPYVNDSLVKLSCSFCGQSLCNQGPECFDDKQCFSGEARKYSDWRFLTYCKSPLFPKLNGISYEKACAVSMFYISNKEKEINYTESLDIFGRYIFLTVKRILNDTGKQTITVNQLLTVLRNLNISLETFSKVDIPIPKTGLTFVFQ